jgi:hypothetical protein
MMTQEHKLGWLVGSTAAFSYLLRLNPGIDWHDGGEFTAAAFQLGVPHPTGFPPLMMAAKLLSLIPLGSVPLRLGLLCALCAGIGLGLLAWLACRLFRRIHECPGTAAVGVLLTCTILACSPTLTQNATTIEAYWPSLTLLLLALVLAERWRTSQDQREAVGLALLYGWGATLHVTVRLGGLLPLWGTLNRSAWRLRTLAALGLAGSVGLGALVYLPLAAWREGPVNWGNPQTLAAFWDHVTGGRIRRAFVDRMLNPAWFPLDSQAFGERLVEDLGWPCLLLALVGASALLRRRERLGLFLLALGLLDGLYSVMLNPMGLVDRQTGLVAELVLACCAGGALAELARWRKWQGPRPAAGLVLLAAGVALQPLAEAWSWRGPGQGPANYVTETLAELPPNGALLCASDALCGGALWAQYVDGQRPDLVVLPRQHLWDQDLRRDRMGRHGGPAPIAGAGRTMTTGRFVAFLGEGRQLYWQRSAADRGDRQALGVRQLAPAPALPTVYRVEGTDLSLRNSERRLQEAVRRWYGAARPPDVYGRRAVAVVLSGLAMTAAEQENWALAWHFQEASTRLHPRSAAYLNLAGLLQRRGETNAVWPWIQRALDEEPGSTRALVMAGHYHLAANEDREARCYFRRARRLCPTRCGRPLEGLGILAARAGDYEKARALLSEALRRQPSLEDARINLNLLPPTVPES